MEDKRLAREKAAASPAREITIWKADQGFGGVIGHADDSIKVQNNGSAPFFKSCRVSMFRGQNIFWPQISSVL